MSDSWPQHNVWGDRYGSADETGNEQMSELSGRWRRQQAAGEGGAGLGRRQVRAVETVRPKDD